MPRNDEVLEQFRHGPYCEFCGLQFVRTEPHHVYTKGSGGRDIKENLVAVGPHDTPWICNCHEHAQAYRIPRLTQLTVIAFREKLTVEEVERINREARRLK